MLMRSTFVNKSTKKKKKREKNNLFANDIDLSTE